MAGGGQFESYYLFAVRESEKHWFNCKTALKTTLESLRKHPQISLKRDDNNKGTSQGMKSLFYYEVFILLNYIQWKCPYC